jgi:hypothetical protein
VARSGKADVAAWVLNDAKDKRLRMTERFMLVAYVSVTPKTRDQGYDWLKANVDDLLKGGGGVFLGARLPQIWAASARWTRPPRSSETLRPNWRANPASWNWTAPWSACAAAAC